MMRLRVLACLAMVSFAAALGGGCGLLVGFPDRALGSTDGTGGATASSGGPGGASTGSSAAATSGTSGTAAASSSTGGPSTYCQSLTLQPLFCDDFEAGPLSPTWVQQPFPNGSAALSTAQAKSPPGHSFEASYLGGGDPSANLGQIHKDFPASYATMRLGFDVFIQEYAADGELTYIAEIDLDNGYGALLYAVPGAATIQQRSPMPPALGHEINSSAGLGFQTWTHVDIDIDLTLKNMKGPFLVLSIDQTTTIPQGDLLSGWSPGAPTIRLGDVVVNTGAKRDVYYDNVVFNAP
ncbi:MAG: hypothetical protein ABJE95_04940 [Byssovorax sp.]